MHKTNCMKKMIVSLFAIFAFSFISFAQSEKAENPNNKFDYLGKIHNNGLKQIASDISSINSFKKDWIETTITILKDNKLEVSSSIKYMNEEKSSLILGYKEANDLNTISVEKLDYFHSNGFISDDANKFLKEILDLTSQIEEIKDLELIKTKFIDIESEISKLENSDKEFLLSVASITRHSVFYWSNNSTISNNSAKLSWGGAAKADLGGAVAGGIRFGVLAAFGGPAGWGACGIACLAGGLGASAGYCIAFW